LVKGADDLDAPRVPKPPGPDSPHREDYVPPSLNVPEAPFGFPRGEDADRGPFDGPGLDDEPDLEDQVPNNPDETHVPDPEDYLPPWVKNNPFIHPDLHEHFADEEQPDLDDPWPDPPDIPGMPNGVFKGGNR